MITHSLLNDENVKKYFNEHPDQLQWISAAIGSAVGKVTGGSATTGASIAVSGTKNNWQASWCTENGKALGGHDEIDEDFVVAAGLDQEFIQMMNDASKYTDRAANQIGSTDHAMPNDSYEKYTSDFLENYEKGKQAIRDGDKETAAKYFGIAVHIMSDFHAHAMRGAAGTWTQHIIGGVKTDSFGYIGDEKHNPDNPEFNEWYFNEAKNAAKLLGTLFAQDKPVNEYLPQLFPKTPELLKFWQAEKEEQLHRH